MKTYKYCAVQIVGTLENWGYDFWLSENSYSTVKKAYNAGLKHHGHDDFIVMEFIGDKCVAVHVKEKGRFDKQSNEFNDYIDGINEEIGLC
jgi:hypothetical protein